MLTQRILASLDVLQAECSVDEYVYFFIGGPKPKGVSKALREERVAMIRLVRSMPDGRDKSILNLYVRGYFSRSAIAIELDKGYDQLDAIGDYLHSIGAL